MKMGATIGLLRRATILGFNFQKGTVRVGLDEGSLAGHPNEFVVPCPLAWAGNDGEYMGGCPSKGSSVVISQGNAGEWYVVSYLSSNGVFDGSFISSQSTRMSALRPGRILLQTKNENRAFLDPKIGFQAGSPKNFLQVNPNANILSSSLKESFFITEASRSLDQRVKRDRSANRTRNVLGSTLTSQQYDTQLSIVGMDPTAAPCPKTAGDMVRNPSLVEQRELIYEFENSFDYTTDRDESARYKEPSKKEPKATTSRRDMRSDALSLSLEWPNHLMETIKGTAVDVYGNILDINRVILPIGQIDDLSLKRSKEKDIAFNKIRALHRRALAFHFEMNVRKGGVEPVAEEPPDVADFDKENEQIKDYGRNRSRLFVNIDKEGQFKINIPASSEIGNIPLLTRYESFSVTQAKKDSGVTHPNQFIRNAEGKDILLENFAGKAGICLSASGEVLDGYEAPIDRNTNKPIKYGTAFHDIQNTCFSFQKSSPYLDPGETGEPTADFITWDSTNRLNTTWEPLEKIVSEKIIVSGPDANAGGRSGLFSSDGMISLNIGANTIDRQSLWLDFAGGIVANVGRDRNNVSYAASLDGDMIIQIGGAGIGNTFDSRFADLNDANQFRNLQIHVITTNGVMVFKMGTDPAGGANAPAAIDLISPGKISLTCQQDLLLKSNSRIMVDAPTIEMHAGTTGSKRQVTKFPRKSI
jgi:hypothetical protein